MKAAGARILLTGACGGIGEASAAVLARAGASLMLTGRSPARLAAQARTLTSGRAGDSPRVEWHCGDLARAADLTALCEAARAWGCNVVIHGAGVAGFGRLESVSAEDMARLLQINLLAPMLLTQALLPHLRSLPKAQVICIGSVLGRIGLPGFSVYSASKFGLRGFAEALRRELADGPVRVQYLGPRTTRTGFNSREVEGYNRATGTAMDDPETVARALLQMLETEAAERFLGFPEKLAVRLNGIAPTLLDDAFAKHRRSLPALPAQPPAKGQAAPSPTADSRSFTPFP